MILKQTLLAMTLAASFPLFAASPITSQAPAVPQVLQCRLAVFYSDLPNGSEEKNFTMPLVGASTHGGEPLRLDFSNGHSVSVLVDGRWLGIDWSHVTPAGEEHIAEVVTVLRDVTTTARVLIVYSPANPDYHADLDCLVP